MARAWQPVGPLFQTFVLWIITVSVWKKLVALDHLSTLMMNINNVSKPNPNQHYNVSQYSIYICIYIYLYTHIYIISTFIMHNIRIPDRYQVTVMARVMSNCLSGSAPVTMTVMTRWDFAMPHWRVAWIHEKKLTGLTVINVGSINL